MDRTLVRCTTDGCCVPGAPQPLAIPIHHDKHGHAVFTLRGFLQHANFPSARIKSEGRRALNVVDNSNPKRTQSLPEYVKKQNTRFEFQRGQELRLVRPLANQEEKLRDGSVVVAVYQHLDPTSNRHKVK
jgi:hypothetical protein